MLIGFVLISCDKQEDQESKCNPEEVTYDLDLDFSSVLNHETTDSTTHIILYYEDYFDLGNLVKYQKYSFLNSTKFNEEICLPITENPNDSVIIAILLIQNDKETNSEPGIFLNVPINREGVNHISEAINSTHLWDRPECKSMPTVFQNREAYIDGPQLVKINVAGSFGVGVTSNADRTLDEIELIGNEVLLDSYEIGWCPCSKYYVKFIE